MIDNFKAIKYSLPDEPESIKNSRFQKMAADLFNMVNELKAEYEKNNDKAVKDQLLIAVESLENLKEKIQNQIN